MQVAIEKIYENPDNPRTISEEMFEKLCNSIKEDPLILEAKPLVVTKHADGFMALGGNMRLKALKHLGYTEVPIFDATHWSEDTKRRFIVKDNLSNGQWNYDMLANQYDLSELESWGFEGLDKYFIEEPDEKDDEVPETPEEPKTKLGDLYELGRHKVLCGDSTQLEEVLGLLDGNSVDMVFTDPPYGIGYEYNEHKDTTGDEYLSFCDEWFNTLQAVKPTYIAISTGWKYQKYWWNKDPRDCMYWLSRNKRTGGTAFHFRKVEPIFVWGDPHKKYDFDFFEQNTEVEEGLREKHTCPKPVSLIVSFIEKGVDYSKNVLDIFLGSGTTLIACEKTNRNCYGIELDPKYVDVIVQRYVDFTGNNKIKKNGVEIEW